MTWIVICDEASALGWRLAGAESLIADEQTVEGFVADARQRADLLFITADLARQVPETVLGAALVAEKPLLAVIAAATGGSEPCDLEQQVKHTLGLAV